MRCGEAHTREKEWKWKVRLTTGVADRFALGISTPKWGSGGLTVCAGLGCRGRTSLGLDGSLILLSILYGEMRRVDHSGK